MTKGENRQIQRRQTRRVLKNVELDVNGSISGRRISRQGYGTGVSRGDFARSDDVEPSPPAYIALVQDR